MKREVSSDSRLSGVPKRLSLGILLHRQISREPLASLHSSYRTDQ